MKYLTDDGYVLLQNQIKLAYQQLEFIEKNIEPGSYAWRIHRRYIDGLEFLIDME